MFLLELKIKIDMKKSTLFKILEVIKQIIIVITGVLGANATGLL